MRLSVSGVKFSLAKAHCIVSYPWTVIRVGTIMCCNSVLFFNPVLYLKEFPQCFWLCGMHSYPNVQKWNLFSPIFICPKVISLGIPLCSCWTPPWKCLKPNLRPLMHFPQSLIVPLNIYSISIW